MSRVELCGVSGVGWVLDCKASVVFIFTRLIVVYLDILMVKDI